MSSNMKGNMSGFSEKNKYYRTL